MSDPPTQASIAAAAQPSADKAGGSEPDKGIQLGQKRTRAQFEETRQGKDAVRRSRSPLCSQHQVAAGVAAVEGGHLAMGGGARGVLHAAPEQDASSLFQAGRHRREAAPQAQMRAAVSRPKIRIGRHDPSPLGDFTSLFMSSCR